MLNTYGLNLRGIKEICSYTRKGLFCELWYNSGIEKLHPVYMGMSEHDFVDEYYSSLGYTYCGSLYRKMTMQEIANQVYMWILQTRIF